MFPVVDHMDLATPANLCRLATPTFVAGDLVRQRPVDFKCVPVSDPFLPTNPNPVRNVRFHFYHCHGDSFPGIGCQNPSRPLRSLRPSVDSCALYTKAKSLEAYTQIRMSQD